MPTDLPQRPPSDRPPSGSPSDRSRERHSTGRAAPPPFQAIFAAITLAALATLVLMPILGDHGGRDEPFLVAVPPPRVVQAGSLGAPHVDQLVTTLQDAAERHLAGREGLLWTPTAAAESDDEAAAAARAAGADEALVVTIGCDSVCRGAVRRLRAVDASTSWQRPRFQIPLEEPLAIEEALGDQIAVAYLKFTRRPGAPTLYARADDYRRFLELRRQMDDAPSPASLADELAAVREGSPRFFASYLFEARLRDRAGAGAGVVINLLENAHRIAPADPRPLLAAIPVLVRSGRTVEAEDLVRELASLYPDHPRLESLKTLTSGTADAPSDSPAEADSTDEATPQS